MGGIRIAQKASSTRKMLSAMANVGKARRMVKAMSEADLTDVAESLIVSAGLMGNRQIIRIVMKHIRKVFKKQAKRLRKEQKPVTTDAIMEYADKEKRAFDMFERQLGISRQEIRNLAEDVASEFNRGKKA